MQLFHSTWEEPFSPALYESDVWQAIIGIAIIICGSVHFSIGASLGSKITKSYGQPDPLRIATDGKDLNFFAKSISRPPTPTFPASLGSLMASAAAVGDRLNFC